MKSDSPTLIILLSGHVSVGKTTVARAVTERLDDAVLVSSRKILEGKLEREVPTRAALQALGEALDSESGGMWLCSAALHEVSAPVVVVDAVRTRSQIDALAAAAVSALHVHLRASQDVLSSRYEERRVAQPELELPSYDAVLADRTEATADDLGRIADIVIDTGRWPADVCTEIVSTAARLVADR